MLWPEGAAVGTPGVTHDAAQHNGLSRSQSVVRVVDTIIEKEPKEVNWFLS